MGNTAPVASKDSGNASAPEVGIAWGHSCMQGWRDDMEDAHFAMEALPGDGWEDTAAFGIMDGHGGKLVAEFCKRYLPENIGRGSSQDPNESLISAFQRMDEILLGGAQYLSEGMLPIARAAERSGCTCVVALVRLDSIVVANAGDCRAVLCRQGRALPLSMDHVPHLPWELERIHRAGGRVVQDRGCFRVNGTVNVSRAIGDLENKRNPRVKQSQQALVSTPDVVVQQRDAGDEFLLLACDGVWEVLGNDRAVEFVRERLPTYMKGGITLSNIVEELMSSCLSSWLPATQGVGGDNMTAILVVFGPAGLAVGRASQAALASPLPSKDQIGSRLLSSADCNDGQASRGCFESRHLLARFCGK